MTARFVLERLTVANFCRRFNALSDSRRLTITAITDEAGDHFLMARDESGLIVLRSTSHASAGKLSDRIEEAARGSAHNEVRAAA